MSPVYRWDGEQYVALSRGGAVTPPGPVFGPSLWGTANAVLDDPAPGDLTEWPDETNSGYLGSWDDLIPFTGEMDVTTEGAIIENRLITGPVYVKAPNVTIRNCVIRDAFYGVDANFGFDVSGLLIEDTTFVDCASAGTLINGINGLTIRRCQSYGGYDGFKFGGSNILFRDNYVHSLSTVGEDPHNDGVQTSSLSSVQFINNRIISPDTSCIITPVGEVSGMLVQGNNFTGGGWQVYAGADTSGTSSILDNVFTGWTYGPVTDLGTTSWINNRNASDQVIDTNGNPL